MHMPERWGFVQFSGLPAGGDGSVRRGSERAREVGAAAAVYRQRAFRARTGGYATALDPLNVSDVRVEGLDFRPVMHATPSHYEIVAPGFAGATAHISQDGRVWVGR